MLTSYVILLVTGALTAVLAVGIIAPQWATRMLLGGEPADVAMTLAARHWLFMGSAVGFSLMYAAFHPDWRMPVMVFAIAEKLALGAFVVTSPLRTRLMTVLVAGADSVMALLFLLMLGGVLR